MPIPVAGDVIVQLDLDCCYVIRDALTRRRLGVPIATLALAVLQAARYARRSPGVWYQQVDNRGRLLGDAYRVGV
jgi:hypothetical protein